MKKIILILIIILIFSGVYSQSNKGILVMPKDTSKFMTATNATKNQMVMWSDSTVKGYNIIYLLYCNMTASQSIRTAISNGCAKEIGKINNSASNTQTVSAMISDSLNQELKLKSIWLYDSAVHNYSRFYVFDNTIMFYQSMGNKVSIQFSDITSDRGYVLPDKTGIIALTSDIPTVYPTDTNLMRQTIHDSIAGIPTTIPTLEQVTTMDSSSSHKTTFSNGLSVTPNNGFAKIGVDVQSSYGYAGAEQQSGFRFFSQNFGYNKIGFNSNMVENHSTGTVNQLEGFGNKGIFNQVTDGGTGYFAYGDESYGIFNLTSGLNFFGIYNYSEGSGSVPLQNVSSTSDTVQINIGPTNTTIFRGDGTIITPNLSIAQIKTRGIKVLPTVEYTSAQIHDSIVAHPSGGSTLDTTYVYKAIGAKLDSSIFYNQDTLTKEPTGFTNNTNIGVSYDTTARKITLTGQFEAYYNGRKITALTNGWQSAAHVTTLNKTYYLYYNGTTFVFDTIPWQFYHLQIAMCYYSTADKIGYREVHGFMQWQSHQNEHLLTGTILVSGGDISGVTLASTTPANRRPVINATTLRDEDLESIDSAFVSKLYTQIYLVGSGATRTFTKSAAEIVPVLSANPYYNSFTGGTWGQTLFANNAYGAVFVMAVPVANSSNSQRYRYEFVQPQQVSTTLATIQALSPTSLNLGDISSDEYNFIGKIIIRYAGSDWTIISTEKLLGTKFNQTAISCNFMTVASTDGVTITGNGTPTNPLGAVKSVWADISGTPTRASSTTFTTTGDLTSYIAKGMVIKWTENTTVRCGMVSIPSTFGSPNTTVTMIGDTIVAAGFDVGSVKYYMGEVTQARFAYAGTVGAVDTNVFNAYYATQPMRVLGADLQVGTSGTTNNSTFDINKKYSISGTMFSVKPTLATTVKSSPTPFTAVHNTSLALGDKVLIDCDAIQTTSAIDAYIQLYLFPSRILTQP